MFWLCCRFTCLEFKIASSHIWLFGNITFHCDHLCNDWGGVIAQFYSFSSVRLKHLLLFIVCLCFDVVCAVWSMQTHSQLLSSPSMHKQGPAWPVGLMSDLCSVCVFVPGYVCVFGLFRSLEVISWNKNAILSPSPPVYYSPVLKGPFPALAEPSADLCHQGKSLCHITVGGL